MSDEVTIYTLLLEGGFYYVGRVGGGLEEVQRRFAEHKRETGSAWTSLHPPLQILSTKLGAPEDEDATVKALWRRHGKDRVRGGSYSQPILDEPQTRGERRELEARGAADACFKCGRASHFSGQCYARSEVQVAPDCARCGRDSHSEAQCYASTHENGQRLQAPRRARSRSRERQPAGCARCGRASHTEAQCYARVSGSEGGGSRGGRGGGSSGDGCYRCGRTSHYASECFARL